MEDRPKNIPRHTSLAAAETKPKRIPNGKGMEKYLTEEDLTHIAVANYIRAQYPAAVFHHSPNEGKRSRTQQYKIKRMGVKKGFPDLVIFHQGRHLAIELKTQTGTASPEQRAWVKFLSDMGWTARVCRGFDECKAVIDQFMKAAPSKQTVRHEPL